MREMAASQAVKAVAMMDKLGTLASGARARGVMVSKAVMGATLISKAVKVVGMRMIPFLLFRCRATIAVAVAVGEEPVVGEERDPERGVAAEGFTRLNRVTVQRVMDKFHQEEVEAQRGLLAVEAVQVVQLATVAPRHPLLADRRSPLQAAFSLVRSTTPSVS